MKKQLTVLITGSILLLVFVLGGYFYKLQQTEKFGFMAKENASTFIREYSKTIGSDRAEVYLVEFSDPACETCSQFHPLVKRLMAEYKGKIKLVIRYAPFHEGSDGVVKMLEASEKQGKYWETLELMYQTQQYWATHHNPQPELLWKFLPRLGLDMERLKADMNDPEIERRLKQDIQDAKTLGVRKTPSFFVNGKPLVSFGYNQLRALIASEIKENY